MKMRFNPIWCMVGLVMLPLLVVSCSSGGGGGDDSGGPFSGSWHITGTSRSSSFTETLVLSQSGSSVHGHEEIRQRGYSGSVNANNVCHISTEEGHILTTEYILEIVNGQLEGEYRAQLWDLGWLTWSVTGNK